MKFSVQISLHIVPHISQVKLLKYYCFYCTYPFQKAGTNDYNQCLIRRNDVQAYKKHHELFICSVSVQSTQVTFSLVLSSKISWCFS